MNHFPAKSRLQDLRLLWIAALAAITLLLSSLPSQAQTLTKTIEHECVAFDYAPDGRIAFAVRRVISVRRIQMQRDDIWLAGLDGKQKRIVDGERLVQGGVPFSYSIHSLRWAPDGRNLTVEMSIRYYTDFEKGITQDSYLTLLIDERGKELRIGGGRDGAIPEADNAAWLADGATVVYQTEAVQPKLLFSLNKVRPASGRGSRIFSDSQFVAVAHDPARSRGLAVERDAALANPPQLVLLDYIKETRKEVLTLEAYLGKLTISPSGAKFAYFRNADTLEIRSLDQPGQVATVRIAFGDYAWTMDESRLLFRRGVERKSSDLLWVNVPKLGETTSDVVPALHGTPFRDFGFSRDGKWLAVVEPGRQHIQIYALQP
jgi:hypothetical protein